MTKPPYSREISFEAVLNFRDLGGYQTAKDQAVTWRRLFRSGELHKMTPRDAKRFKEEIELNTVLDLRSNFETERHGLGLVSGFKYHNVSLIADGGDNEANARRFNDFTDMGQFYFYLAGQKEFTKGIIQCLEIIADPANHPLVFHCSLGKDRTGILAAILLSVIEVAPQDIINDFLLTAPYAEIVVNRMKNNPRPNKDSNSIPDYFWQVTPESIAFFLTGLKNEYGSTKIYLEAHGAKPSLFKRLESTLLV
jgi:protein-tyrosine phosphatase